jgi:hypothetical protein
MKKYISYKIDNGEITREGMCTDDDDFSLQVPLEGTGTVLKEIDNTISVRGDTHYLDISNTEEILIRPTFSIIQTGLIFTNIPTGTLVKIVRSTDLFLENPGMVVDDGELDLIGSDAGEYMVIFENFPYREMPVRIVISSV